MRARRGARLTRMESARASPRLAPKQPQTVVGPGPAEPVIDGIENPLSVNPFFHELPDRTVGCGSRYGVVAGGEFLGSVHLSKVFGVDYPWITDFEIAPRNKAFFSVSQQREGQGGEKRSGVYEGMIFRTIYGG